MSRNVEIKAKIDDLEGFLATAASVSDKPEVILHQVDTYFKVPNGRLKLRQIQDFENAVAMTPVNVIEGYFEEAGLLSDKTLNEKSELIFYDRPDTEAPKLSNYSKQEFQNFEESDGLKKVLESSLGLVGEVSKQRHLFISGQTRIHVDDVKNLGHFMELEVMLKEGESLQYGEKIAQELMTKLGVDAKDLLSGSYINLLTSKGS